MATYTFNPVPAWGAVGQFARVGVQRSGTFPCTLPGGGDATVVQGGVTKVGYVESDATGLVAEFTTTDIPSVVVDFGVGPLTIHSLEAISAGAASAAAAASSATAASGSASDAAASAADAAATLAGKVDKGTLAYYAADYASIQACLDAAPAGSIVKLDSATITTALSITKAVNIVGGGQANTILTCNGCDGFVVANGVGDVTIQRLAIRTPTAARYTTTVNAFIGIKILGDAADHPSVHTYRDIYIDGFETGIQSNYLWTSTFDNVQTAFGLIGLDAYGLSENNTVKGGNFVAGNGTNTRLAGSACIRLNGQVSRTDTTSIVSEGWVISGGAILFGGDFGLQALGYGNYQIANCILDSIQISGVRVANNGTAYGGNALIQGNYIAMASNAVSGAGAIEIANTVGATRGVKVVDNDLLVYAGGAVPYGVHTIANAGSTALVRGNTIDGFNAADIRFESSNNMAIGNRCTTPVGSLSLSNNIFSDSGQLNLVSDNVGAVFISGATSPNTYTAQGGRKVMFAAAAPTAGTWVVGDKVVRRPPVVGSPKGWVCTVAGTPGTWVSEGNL